MKQLPKDSPKRQVKCVWYCNEYDALFVVPLAYHYLYNDKNGPFIVGWDSTTWEQRNFYLIGEL